MKDIFEERRIKINVETKKKLILFSRTLNLTKVNLSVIKEIFKPLTIIHLATEKLEQPLLKKEEKLDLIRMIKGASGRISALAEIDLSLNDPSFPEDVFTLDEEIEKIKKTCLDEAKKRNVEIYYKSKQNYHLFAFRKELKIVLLNLVLNAIESYPLVSSNNKSKTTDVYIKVSKNEYYLLIEIKDLGRGFSQEKLTNIFKLNIQHDCQVGNMGIGLYVADSIMRQYYKKKIFVKSQLGKGSSFTLRIKNEFLMEVDKPLSTIARKRLSGRVEIRPGISYPDKS